MYWDKKYKLWRTPNVHVKCQRTKDWVPQMYTRCFILIKFIYIYICMYFLKFCLTILISIGIYTTQPYNFKVCQFCGKFRNLKKKQQHLPRLLFLFFINHNTLYISLSPLLLRNLFNFNILKIIILEFNGEVQNNKFLVLINSELNFVVFNTFTYIQNYYNM